MSGMSIAALRRHIEAELAAIGIDESERRAEADLIIRKVCRLSLAEEMKEPEQSIEENTLKSINEMLSERRKRHPLQYLLGETEFYGLKFQIAAGVLIPRADTETLIEESRAFLAELAINRQGQIKIGEIGCGSGIIALTLLKLFENMQASVCDISPKAIEVSNQNAEVLNLSHRYQASLEDWQDFLLREGKSLDLLLSNPPYIPRKASPSLAPEVLLYEPEIALFGEDEDGLGFYRQLSANSSLLAPNCRVILEIGFGQCRAVQDIFQNNGWHKKGVRKDLNNIARTVSFAPPNSPF